MLANNALTTLDFAKRYIGYEEGNNERDEFLTFCINSASSMIEQYCNRNFGLRTYHEIRQGTGSMKLILDHYPIIEVKELLIGGQPVNIERIKVLSDSGMLYRPDGGFPAHTITGKFLYPRPDEDGYNIFVKYSAGYVLPKDATEDNPRTLPYDLEKACLKMVRLMNKDKDVAEGKSLILKREQLGDWMSEYEPEFKNEDIKLTFFNSDVLDILSSYKRTEFSV